MMNKKKWKKDIKKYIKNIWSTVQHVIIKHIVIYMNHQVKEVMKAF